MTFVYDFNVFSILKAFEEMSDRAGSLPEDTASIVALSNYLKECKQYRLVDMKREITASFQRLLVLIEYAQLPGTK